jgi:hypothetical protein
MKNKNFMACVFCFFLIATTTWAQWSGYESMQGSELDAGMGMTWIDNNAYYAITLMPDLSFGKFGVGLGVYLLWDTKTGKIRTSDWETKGDYLRMIRYLRYGQKGDNFYTRVGALDAERLGHGFMIHYYNNQISFDNRKIGLTLDLDLGSYGFETLTNNLGRLEVVGVRGYFRPIYSSAVPILRDFAIGASYITDMDPDGWKGTTDDRVSIWGVDAELPIIKSNLLNTILYTDYAQIVDYGNGAAVGLGVFSNTLFGLLKAGVNIERRFLGKSFIPHFIDPFYEVMRYSSKGELIDYYGSLGGDAAGIPDEILPLNDETLLSKKSLLPMMNQKRQGWFASLYLDFLYLIRVYGSFQKIDEVDDSGILHAEADLSQTIPFLALEASYDKRGIHTFEDIRTLDYRSVARVGIGYKIKPFLLLYLDYIWNFEWDESLQRYKPQERFQPRLAFRYRFNQR